MKVPFCKNRFRKSHFNRIVYLCNSPPQKVRRDANLESFIKDQILHVFLIIIFKKQRYVVPCFYVVFALIAGYF